MPKNLKPLFISFALATLLIPNLVSAQVSESDTSTANNSTCITISNNIRTSARVKATGIKNSTDDVLALQDFLVNNNYLNDGSVTGYFGPATAAAIATFQKDNNIAISTPIFVGAVTRAKIHTLSCGGTTSNNTNNNTTNPATTNNNPTNTATQSSTPSPTITLTSPKSGATFTQGGNIYINWTSSNAPTGAHVALFLVNTQTGTSLGIITRNKAVTGSYTWSIPTPKTYTCSSCTGIYNAPPIGSYKVVAKIYTPTNAFFQEGIAMNSNNLPEPTYLATTESASFKIIGPTNTNPLTVVSSQNTNLPTSSSTNNSTLPAGCTSTAGFSSTVEGLSCASQATAAASAFPAGCTSNTGMSVTTGKPCGIVYAKVSNPQTNILLEGAGARKMDFDTVFPNVPTLVQKYISDYVNQLNANITVSNNFKTNNPGNGQLESLVTSDTVRCIKINGDLVYGSLPTVPDATRICPNITSPSYKSATFTPIASAPLIGQPLDSADVSKLIVEPTFGIGGAAQLHAPRGLARSFQITTGDVGEIGRFMTEESNLGNLVDLFMNLSTAPNDFRYNNLDDGHNGCAGTGGFPQLTYRVVNPADPGVMACRLKPHTTYYLNVRNEAASKVNGSRGKDSAIYDGGSANANAYLLQFSSYRTDDKTSCSSVGDFCSDARLNSGTEYAK